VVRDDHLSPLLGMMVADLVGLEKDRAVALEQSLVASMQRHGGVTKVRFDKHWEAASAAPALLLNATWVETGYRVAFAPFTLGGMRDGTLYAFGDPSLGVNKVVDVSLAGAAVVSARFPGVVPAFTFVRPVVRNGVPSLARWNFVDGGYSDESGSATALEIYKALEPIANEKDSDIDLRLILLTNSRPAPNFDEIEGTVARDVLTPALTVLRVRDLLSRQAVMRTITEIEDDLGRRLALQEKRSAAQLGEEKGWKVTLVELDHESFTLALGWKMSNATNTLVSLMVGHSDLCAAMATRAPTGPGDSEMDQDGSRRNTMQISAGTIRANSCVMQAVSKLIDRGP
jgi:hypothetical protein